MVAQGSAVADALRDAAWGYGGGHPGSDSGVEWLADLEQAERPQVKG
jgi:hypothetical protein